MGTNRVLKGRTSASGLRWRPRAKARRKRTPDGLPVQSFQDWLKDLATITKNRMEPADKTIPSFEMTTRPTVPQTRALELLKVKL